MNRDHSPAVDIASLKEFISTHPFKCSMVVSRFNDDITSMLLTGAKTQLGELGITEAEIRTVYVPGAFELPLAAKHEIAAHQASAVLCLGAVIKGDTPHFDYVCAESARGIQQVTLETSTPVIFGVLTTNTLEQAIVRANPDKENKGAECALAAVEMAKLLSE